MSKFFTLNWRDVGGAVATAVVVAVGSYILKVANVWAMDWHTLVNNAVLAGVGVIVMTLGTTSEGKFVGVVPVK